MATTITTADWTATGALKEGSWQALTVSKQKVKVFNVAFGCADTYSTGGQTLDLSDGGRIKTVVFVTVSQTSNPALIPAYTASACSVASTGKVKFFQEVAAACSTALSEIACGSCLIQCDSFKVFVIGT